MSARSMIRRFLRPSLLLAWVLASIVSFAAGCGGDRVVRFRVLFSGDLRSYVEPCT